jgi:hypothetical protein
LSTWRTARIRLRTLYLKAQGAACLRAELRRAEIRLREGLAQEEALLHQKDKLIQQRAALSKLFARREDAANRVASRTRRQRQIMSWFSLATPIRTSPRGTGHRAVENHRASIMKKTGTKSLPALARLVLAAARNGADEPLVQPLARLALTANTETRRKTFGSARASLGT